MLRLLSVLLAAAVVLPVATVRPALAQGDWEVTRDPFDRQVIARYKRILERNPSDRAALRNLVSLYKRHRSLSLLLDEYGAALERNPDDFSAAMVLGHVHRGEGNAERAIAFYERAAAIRPADVAPPLALGELHRNAGDVARARAAYEHALSHTRSAAQKKTVLRALADLALATDDIAAARGFFADYLALDPGDVQTRIDLGDALLRHGQHADAVTALREAETRLRRDPARRVEVVARIGAALEAGGDEDGAVREYRRAIGMVARDYYMRRELTARIVEVSRRRQALPELVGQLEKEWPAARRGHFEWDLLAQLYEETGRQDAAIDAYRQATRRAPHELDTQRRLIALLSNSGREDEAIRQYEVVVRVAPGEPRFALELAQRYWERGEQQKALALLARIAGRFPGDGGVHAAVAELYSRWGKDDLALRTYERLIRIEPGDVTHLVNLGEQYYQRDQKDRAIAVWKRIISRKTGDNYARLAEVYAAHDMLGDALALYTTAVKLEPRNPERYKGRAAVYERQRRWDDAIGDWEQVLALVPTDAASRPARREARRRVVNLLKRAGQARLRERMTAWQRAFLDDPPDMEAGYFLVEAQVREQQHERARRTLERILTLTPDDLDAMGELVKVYRRQHEYDKAVALLLELAERSPGREAALYNEIAEIRTAERGKDDEAIYYAHKALDQNPNNPVAYQRLAERYVEMQRFDDAITAYEKTVELDPRNFRVHFVLAQLYKHTYQPAKAAALYRGVLERATDDELLHRAGREAIDLAEMTGTLGELERTVTPLAFTYAHKGVYRRILVELYDSYVPRLVRQRQRGDDAARARAAEELARLGASGLKPLLEALSDDRDVTQQRIAVSVLGYLGNKGAAAPLVRLAAEAPRGPDAERRRIGTLLPTLDWDVRVDALIAAGRLADARTIGALIEIGQHREKSMREAAAFALGMTGDRRAVAPLRAALDDSVVSVQAMACLALSQVADGRELAALAAVMGDQRRHDHVRAACAFALGELGDRRAVPALLEVIASGNSEVQRLAAWSLGRLGDPRAVPPLLAAYFNRHEPVRETVAWALAQIGSGAAGPPPAIDRAEYPLRNGSHHTEAAIAALPGPLVDPPLRADLLVGHEAEVLRGLQGAFERHRDLIVRVLEDLDARPARLSLGRLTARLDEAPARSRQAVEEVLGRVGAAIAGDLERLAGHRDPVVRGRALAVLAKIADPRGKAALARGLTDGSDTVRQAAMDAIAVHVSIHGAGAAELIAALAAQLDDGDWQDRRHAARVMGALGAHADESALLAALTDATAYVREEAALALGRLGRKTSLEGLLAVSADPVDQVRAAAAVALGAVGGPRARARLTRMAADDPDEAVRRRAGEAAGKRKK